MKMHDIPRAGQSAWPQKGSDFWRASTRIDRHPLGNLIYYGVGLRSVNGKEPEPALIDPRQPFDSRVKDCRGRGQGRGGQPSYARCSQQMRAAYLHWLNTGRSDAQAPISHVLLYFYGLERRAVHDARSDPAAHAELPVIREEVGRLRRLYGADEDFKERSAALLEYLAAECLPPRSYLQAPVLRDDPLSFVEQMMLGQCAQDAAPLPATWAFRFVQGGLRMWPEGLDPRRVQGLRECFEQVYHQRCGAGLVVPVGSARLQLSYSPASPTFEGVLKRLDVDTGVPSLLEEPQWCAPLLAVVREVQVGLAGGEAPLPVAAAARRASRVPGVRRPAEPPAPEGILDRPFHQWPERPLSFLGDLRTQMRGRGYRVIRLMELSAVFGELRSRTPQSLQQLCEALAPASFGVMPDPRFGNLPAWPELAVLFADDSATASSEPSHAYREAAFRLELCGAVLSGDRRFLQAHERQLSAALKLEQGLTTSERRRLKAVLQLILREPPPLSSLEARLRKLTPAQRLAAAEHLASTVGLHTSAPLPMNVQFALGKCRELLGSDTPDTLTSSSAPATSPRRFAIPAPPPPRRPAVHAVSLDPAKIDALKKEEVRLAELLDPVFREEDVPERTAPSSGERQTPPHREPSSPLRLLDLDPQTSAFLRMLLGRPAWTRTELARLAREHGLPLDGVLERINEASFDRLDMPLFQDGDPLVLRIEAIAAITGEQGGSG